MEVAMCYEFVFVLLVHMVGMMYVVYVVFLCPEIYPCIEVFRLLFSSPREL